MGYMSTSIGNVSDTQLEKNMERIRQQALYGEVSIEDRLDRQRKEILTLKQMKQTLENIKRLNYIIREYNATRRLL